MAQKYDLTDIGNALSRVMDNPMTKIIRSGSIGVLGVVNPVAGIVGGIGLGLAYVTPVAVASKWFPDKQGLVTGMVVMGFGLGALLMAKLLAPVFLNYFENISFHIIKLFIKNYYPYQLL